MACRWVQHPYLVFETMQIMSCESFCTQLDIELAKAHAQSLPAGAALSHRERSSALQGGLLQLAEQAALQCQPQA